MNYVKFVDVKYGMRITNGYRKDTVMFDTGVIVGVYTDTVAVQWDYTNSSWVGIHTGATWYDEKAFDNENFEYAEENVCADPDLMLDYATLGFDYSAKPDPAFEVFKNKEHVVKSEDMKFFSSVADGCCACGINKSDCTYHS